MVRPMEWCARRTLQLVREQARSYERSRLGSASSFSEPPDPRNRAPARAYRSRRFFSRRSGAHSAPYNVCIRARGAPYGLWSVREQARSDDRISPSLDETPRAIVGAALAANGDGVTRNAGSNGFRILGEAWHRGWLCV